MKNQIKSLLAWAWLMLAAFGLQAQTPTPTFRSASFINGCNIFVPTNTTINWGYTNVLYIQKTGAAGLSLSNSVVYYTNAVGTTSNVLTTPNAFADVTIRPDVWGNVNTNVTLIVVLNSTNYFLPGMNLPNPNNSYSAQYNATNTVPYTNVPVATSTNKITLTFERTADASYADYGNYNGTNVYAPFWVFDGLSTWSVNIDNTMYTGNSGVNPVVLCTNLPSWFVTGTKAIRLQSITSGSATGTSAGNILNMVKLGEWGQ